MNKAEVDNKMMVMKNELAEVDNNLKDKRKNNERFLERNGQIHDNSIESETIIKKMKIKVLRKKN